MMVKCMHKGWLAQAPAPRSWRPGRGPARRTPRRWMKLLMFAALALLQQQEMFFWVLDSTTLFLRAGNFGPRE